MSLEDVDGCSLDCARVVTFGVVGVFVCCLDFFTHHWARSVSYMSGMFRLVSDAARFRFEGVVSRGWPVSVCSERGSRLISVLFRVAQTLARTWSFVGDVFALTVSSFGVLSNSGSSVAREDPGVTGTSISFGCSMFVGKVLSVGANGTYRGCGIRGGVFSTPGWVSASFGEGVGSVGDGWGRKGGCVG